MAAPERHAFGIILGDQPVTVDPRAHLDMVLSQVEGAALWALAHNIHQALWQAALTAASEGRGGVAVLTGDRGVGKTALATEVANLAERAIRQGLLAQHAGRPQISY